MQDMSMTTQALQNVLDKLDMISADLTELKLNKGKQEEPVPGLDAEVGEDAAHEAGEPVAFESQEDAGVVTDEVDMAAPEAEGDEEEEDPRKKLDAIFAKAGK